MSLYDEYEEWADWAGENFPVATEADAARLMMTPGQPDPDSESERKLLKRACADLYPKRIGLVFE